MHRHLAAAALLGLALCGAAQGQECAHVIEGNDLIQFDLSEIRVNAECEEVTINLRHVGKLAANVMGHNWVLTTTADSKPLATDAATAGPPGYLPVDDPRIIAASDHPGRGDDPRIIAATGMIGGGEQTSVTFSLAGLEPGGGYTYFCSFPGHYALMNGRFIIE